MLDVAISCTTRRPRKGEEDGRDYYFLSDSEFLAREDGGEFIETAYVHGHRYGTLKSEVERIMNQGNSCILEIDVQGGSAVKDLFPNTVLIFVETPNLDDLEERLRKRKSESDKDIELRLNNAAKEMVLSSSYDEIVVNDDIERATNELLIILQAYENEET